MPELPEVESVRRQLAPLLVGRRIERVQAAAQGRFGHLQRAVGRRVTGLDRRGKYLLAALDGGLELVMHLGMTGSFRVRGRDGWEPDAYVRASFDLGPATEEGCGTPQAREGVRTCLVLDFRDVRRFGRLTVVPAGDYRGIATLEQLGPEPLSDDFDPVAFARALGRTRMPVKPFLLTQRPVAGVGNIYADEALWRARISPAARAVGPRRARRLWAAVRQVLAESIEREGTTFRDYRMVNGGSGRNADFLVAYGQHGRPCPRCGTPLRKVVLGGRGTTFCPVCQRR